MPNQEDQKGQDPEASAANNVSLQGDETPPPPYDDSVVHVAVVSGGKKGTISPVNGEALENGSTSKAKDGKADKDDDKEKKPDVKPVSFLKLVSIPADWSGRLREEGQCHIKPLRSSAICPGLCPGLEVYVIY